MLTKAQLKTWVKALRSGKFKQGIGFLYDDVEDSYCCLGVAARVCLRKTPNQILEIGNKYFDLLSPNVMDRDTQDQFANMNDGSDKQSRKSFKQIATWIENNLIVNNKPTEKKTKGN